MSEPALIPLTLHPLVDAQHRWRAFAIDCTNPADPGCAPTCALWLDALHLDETLGTMPLLLPALAPADCTEGLLGSLPPGRAMLPLAAGADADGAQIDALVGRGVTVLHMAGGTPPQTAGHGRWALLAPGAPIPAAGAAAPRVLLGVDHPEVFKAATTAGWQWLGGRYALQPPDMPRPGQGGGRSIVMRLLGQLATDAETTAIEQTLKSDPQLSYQLLRLVNSAAFALPREITSFSQAINLLGRRQLQRWLQLLLYAQRGDGGVSPLLPRAAWRASLMESLVRRAGGDRDAEDAAFMTGMFSLLELLLGQPMSGVIEPLHLSGPVEDALLRRDGKLGAQLALIDSADALQDVAPRLAAAAISTTDWLAAQVDAARWSIPVSQEA